MTTSTDIVTQKTYTCEVRCGLWRPFEIKSPRTGQWITLSYEQWTEFCLNQGQAAIRQELLIREKFGNKPHLWKELPTIELTSEQLKHIWRVANGNIIKIAKVTK